MKKYDDGYLLWIADLEVQRTLKQREIEQDKVYLKIDSGLSNHDIGRIFLDSLQRRFYELEEIEEELALARQKRAEYLKQCPTQEFFSDYGIAIMTIEEDEEDD
ncbi:MAG: hypothetical protein E7360_06670 [Clostridiales bacterium]|nr:hypothetical protein [Clostridiales bacterium]